MRLVSGQFGRGVAGKTAMMLPRLLLPFGCRR